MKPPHRSIAAVAAVILLSVLSAHSSVAQDAVFLQVICGSGDVLTPFGEIVFPSSSGPSSNVTCTWTFNISSTKPTYLWVKHVSLDLNDSLVLFDGITNITLTGDDGFVQVVHPKSTVIYLTTSTANISRSVNLPFQNNCSYSLTGSSSFVRSPRYSNFSEFGPSIQCLYGISTPGDWLSLTFIAFTNSTGINVSLKFPDHTTRSLDTNVLNEDTILEYGELQFNYTASIQNPSNVSAVEFLYASSNPECTVQNITVNGTYSLLIPPKTSNSPQQCIWIVTGPVNTTLYATLLDPQIDNIESGIITINDGKRRLNANKAIITSASRFREYIVSSGNSLWIGFSSDRPVKPVTLIVTSQNGGGDLVGNGTFYVRAQNTSNAEQTVFTLTADAQKQVLVNVTTPGSLLLPGSVLAFYEGHSYDHEIANFTSDRVFFPIVSYGSKMLVVAKNFTQLANFNATFQSVEPDDYIISFVDSASFSRAGNLTRPVTWTITPKGIINENAIIGLTISQLELGVNDTLVIYNGPSELSSVVARWNGTSIAEFKDKWPLLLYLRALDGARIDLKSAENSSILFSASYEVDPKGCNQEVNVSDGSSFELSTPFYPRPYPLNADCTWKVKSPNGKLLLLSFSDLSIDKLSSLNITTGNTTWLDWSKSQGSLPDDIIVTANNVTVRWISAKNVASALERGVSIQIRSLDCGGKFSSISGWFATPQPSNASVQCAWLLDPTAAVKTNNSDNVLLKFAKSVPELNNANYKIREGGSLVRGAYLDLNASAPLLSTLEKVFIWYQWNTTAGRSAPPFNLTYSVNECLPKNQCKNKICMHDDWVCNGHNNCGDWSDEINCASSTTSASGVSVPVFIVVIFLMFFLGVGMAFLAPIIIRRFRRPDGYTEFRSSIDT